MKSLVFLDHLIQRDGLLYERSDSKAGDPGEYRKTLLIRDLEKGTQRALLRKPDFQRATYAWSPEDCVDLLEAVMTERVVPSVILWLDPVGSQYVLDGGHRISVLLAWIQDDWGDGATVHQLGDETLENAAKQAATEVRKLLAERRIGSFIEHEQAIKEYNRLIGEEKVPNDHMSPSTLAMANCYRRWQSVEAGFPILWVRGDYQKAEASFLAINKSGQRLSEWETSLVENRTAAFARIVMSIAYPDRARHCWPNQGVSGVDVSILNAVLDKVRTIRERLFEFPYVQPIKDHRVPLLGHSSAQPDSGPTYVAEVLTVVEGRRGLPSDTKELLARGRSANAADLLQKADLLTSDALQAIDNIYGPSPRSLSLLPLVYFYNGDGMCIRSLLFGFLHWMVFGTDTAIVNRKLLFTIYRESFEATLIRHKGQIVNRFSRRIGSGGEVTLQLGLYFNGLLALLIKFKGSINSTEFDAEHAELVENYSSKKKDLDEPKAVAASRDRAFRGTTKKKIHVDLIIKGLQFCEICGGMFYPGAHTQIDHKERFRDGGQTTVDNGRVVHPFCNNNRDRIENIVAGKEAIELPSYGTTKNNEKGPQLTFFDNLDFDTPAPWLAGSNDADDFGPDLLTASQDTE